VKITKIIKYIPINWFDFKTKTAYFGINALAEVRDDIGGINGISGVSLKTHQEVINIYQNGDACFFDTPGERDAKITELKGVMGGV